MQEDGVNEEEGAENPQEEGEKMQIGTSDFDFFFFNWNPLLIIYIAFFFGIFYSNFLKVIDVARVPVHRVLPALKQFLLSHPFPLEGFVEAQVLSSLLILTFVLQLTSAQVHTAEALLSVTRQAPTKGKRGSSAPSSQSALLPEAYDLLETLTKRGDVEVVSQVCCFAQTFVLRSSNTFFPIHAYLW